MSVPARRKRHRREIRVVNRRPIARMPFREKAARLPRKIAKPVKGTRFTVKYSALKSLVSIAQAGGLTKIRLHGNKFPIGYLLLLIEQMKIDGLQETDTVTLEPRPTPTSELHATIGAAQRLHAELKAGREEGMKLFTEALGTRNKKRLREIEKRLRRLDDREEEIWAELRKEVLGREGK